MSFAVKRYPMIKSPEVKSVLLFSVQRFGPWNSSMNCVTKQKNR